MRYKVEYTLDCGHTTIDSVGKQVPPTPKRKRCFTCFEEAKDAAPIFSAKCETCALKPGETYARPGQHVTLSSRPVPKARAQDDINEHLAEYPGHRATVYTV